jgi:hypothetical protein
MPHQIQHAVELAKDGADGLSLAVVIAWAVGISAPLASFLTLVWLMFRIFDIYLAIRLKRKQLKGD